MITFLVGIATGVLLVAGLFWLGVMYPNVFKRMTMWE